MVEEKGFSFSQVPTALMNNDKGITHTHTMLEPTYLPMRTYGYIHRCTHYVW